VDVVIYAGKISRYMEGEYLKGFENKNTGI